MATDKSNKPNNSDKFNSLEEIDYHELLLRAQSGRNFFIFRRDFVTSGLLTHLEALFISDLINHATGEKTIRKTIGGKEYFLCTTVYLEKSLAWNPSMQTKLFNSLKKNNFVQTVLKGCPQQRWVWIDIVKLENSLPKRTIGPNPPDRSDHQNKPPPKTDTNVQDRLESNRSNKTTDLDTDTNVQDRLESNRSIGWNPTANNHESEQSRIELCFSSKNSRLLHTSAALAAEVVAQPTGVLDILIDLNSKLSDVESDTTSFDDPMGDEATLYFINNNDVELIQKTIEGKPDHIARDILEFASSPDQRLNYINQLQAKLLQGSEPLTPDNVIPYSNSKTTKKSTQEVKTNSAPPIQKSTKAKTTTRGHAPTVQVDTEEIESPDGGFFADKDVKGMENAADFDFANRLGKALTAARLAQRRPDTKAWATSFARLRHQTAKQRNMSSEKVERLISEVLNDHIANLTDKFQPRAYSANTFFECFPKIELAKKTRKEKLETDKLREQGIVIDKVWVEPEQEYEWVTDARGITTREKLPKKEGKYIERKMRWVKDDNGRMKKVPYEE